MLRKGKSGLGWEISGGMGMIGFDVEDYMAGGGNVMVNYFLASVCLISGRSDD